MRRVHRPLPLLVLIAVLAVAGPPTTASASDAGLRVLVSEQRAEEKRLEKAIEAVSPDVDGSMSTAQITRRTARALRTLATQVDRFRRSYDEYRRRFAAEGPETPQSTQGRDLVLGGLRDGSRAARDTARVTRRFAARVRRARTAEGLERLGERYARESAGAVRVGERSEKRLKRGRTLIRNAPAPAVPAA